MRFGIRLSVQHRPDDPQTARFAEQLATLDVIAGGRLIVGVGLGYRDVENAAMGQDLWSSTHSSTPGVSA